MESIMTRTVAVQPFGDNGVSENGDLRVAAGS